MSAVVEVLPFLFSLMFSFRHNNIMYNLCYRSKSVGRKMYALKRLVVVQPDDV